MQTAVGHFAAAGGTGPPSRGDHVRQKAPCGLSDPHGEPRDRDFRLRDLASHVDIQGQGSSSMSALHARTNSKSVDAEHIPGTELRASCGHDRWPKFLRYVV